MDEYIKRKDAINVFDWGEDLYVSCGVATQNIKDIPSADVVEVTRCEDCIHFDNCAKEIDVVNNGEVHITRIMEWCSHGERAEE